MRQGNVTIGTRGTAIIALVVALVFVFAASSGVYAAEPTKITFPSLDGQTTLDGYLVRPAGEGRHPAMVFLHGCGGMLNKMGRPEARQTAWSETLAARGYVVLMVDSLSPRNQGGMCSPRGFNASVYRARPKDAYGALLWLQAQPFVQADRVGVMGWSEGGGVVLLSIGAESLGRPAALPAGDFRVAVAFYPASCDERKLGTMFRSSQTWTTAIPLLVLVGAGDVWTPAGPCKDVIGDAVAHGTPAEMHIYPDAYHDFDWPDMPQRARPEFETKSGVIPITGTNPAARADALERVPAFLAKYLDAK